MNRVLDPRWFWLILGLAGLFLVYFFQRQLDLYGFLTEGKITPLPETSSYFAVNPLAFAVNKVFRYLLNDLFAMSVIYSLFPQRKYLRFAMLVLLFGLLVLLPLYLFLYLSQPPGYSSMLSHLHRLVMNPVLMFLLIPAYYYQSRLPKGSN